MLEDDYTYVIRKAFKGLNLAPAEAARQAGLPENDVLSFSRGNFSPEIAGPLARALGLKPEALANHPNYNPRPITLPQVHRLDLPFDNERVNAWLIWTDDAVILFDTGYEKTSCIRALESLNTPPIQQIFITHAHSDHTGGIANFASQRIPIHGSKIAKSKPIQPGDTLEVGSLKIRACDLTGHANPALGYHIEGLEFPILVTGDALFAGSIGGCATPEIYQHALKQLNHILAPLPDPTILLPGHGPATTLGEERERNPFL